MNKNEQRINEAMYEVEDEEDLVEQMEKIWDAYLDDKLDTGLVAFVMRHPSATVEMRYGLMKRYGALVLQAMNWSEEYLLQQKNEAEKMMRQIIKDPKTDEYRLNDIYFWDMLLSLRLKNCSNCFCIRRWMVKYSSTI